MFSLIAYSQRLTAKLRKINVSKGNIVSISCLISLQVIATKAMLCVDTILAFCTYISHCPLSGSVRDEATLRAFIILTMCVCACVPMTRFVYLDDETCVSEHMFKTANQLYFA